MILTHHNQSHATYYTYLRFHTSQVSLKIKCYNRYIRENFAHHHTHHTRRQMAQDTVHAQGRSTYDIYIEIDIDCEELVDACGLEYKQCEDDDTQNEICLSLDAEEWSDFKARVDWSPLDTNEQLVGAALLNDELSEYVTKATIYKPTGDVIVFK